VAYNFLACDRDQELLLPPSLREWLPEDHLAWFLIDAKTSGLTCQLRRGARQVLSMPSAGKCRGGLVVEGLVWPVVVVVVSPAFEQDLGFVEGVEGLEFEEFAS
jgi:hypothetical protein